MMIAVSGVNADETNNNFESDWINEEGALLLQRSNNKAVSQMMSCIECFAADWKSKKKKELESRKETIIALSLLPAISGNLSPFPWTGCRGRKRKES